VPYKAKHPPAVRGAEEQMVRETWPDPLEGLSRVGLACRNRALSRFWVGQLPVSGRRSSGLERRQGRGSWVRRGLAS